MKLVKFLAFFLLGFILVTLPVLAQDFPEPTGYVNDFAQIFSSDYRQSLEQELTDFEKETTTEITVVTITSLEGNSLEDYAVRLFEQWQIGKKDKDNGLLILIALEERDIRIEVGYGLEPIITDGRAGKIIREQMTPSFRENDYDQGVRLAVVQLEEYIRSGEAPLEESNGIEEESPFFVLFIVFIFFFVYLASFLARSKSYWAGGVIGGVMGGILGLVLKTLLGFFLLGIGFTFFGLLLDYVLSKNYKKLKKGKKSTGFFSSWGGFSGGGGGGRGFGGFGGGSSGGGGASGGW